MQSATVGARPRMSEALSGVLRGLVPLGALAGTVIFTFLLTALGRLLVAGQGFFVQQTIATFIMAVGLVIAAAMYTIAIVGTLRRIRRWHAEGSAAPALGALWALAASAFGVLLPVLLAAFLPQHPAP